MKTQFAILMMLLVFACQPALPQQEVAGVHIGEYQQEVRMDYATKDGLPSDDVRSVAVTASGDVYAGTALGLARFAAGKWATVAADGEAVEQVAAAGDDVWFISAGKLVHLHGASLPSTAGEGQPNNGGRKTVVGHGRRSLRSGREKVRPRRGIWRGCWEARKPSGKWPWPRTAASPLPLWPGCF